MMIRYSREAQNDIQSLFDCIAVDNKIAAVRVVTAIKKSIDRLVNFPLSDRLGAVSCARELVVPSLPYIAVYMVENETV